MKNNKEINKKLDKVFNESGLKLKKNPFALIKFSKISVKIYQQLCPACRLKTNKNPKMKFEEYCPNCQKKIKPLLEELNKLIE